MSLNCSICKESYDWDKDNKSASISPRHADEPICRGCEEILNSIPIKIKEKYKWNLIIENVKLVKDYEPVEV